MDRIRKALDLAKQERAQLAGAAGSDRPVETPAANASSLRAIDYSDTRVFTPDAKLLEANRIVDPAGTDSVAAAFRMLRTQVLQRLNENFWRSLAVLSPSSNDGKSTTALNLAVSLANDRRHTVLLIDSDLKRPALAAMLGIKPEFGLDDILRGEARVSQCLFHPRGFERLVVLPARAPMEHSSESLAGPRAHALVAELRARYPERIVIFDLPPILGADDALAFMPLVECGLMVVSERRTRRTDLLRSMELLRQTPIIGTVVNRATDVNSGYG